MTRSALATEAAKKHFVISIQFASHVAWKLNISLLLLACTLNVIQYSTTKYTVCVCTSPSQQVYCMHEYKCARVRVLA